MFNLKSYFTKFFANGSQRSIEAKRNIFASFAIKGANIAVNLALVPLTIKYVNPDQYGIWLTLSSIIGWFSFFDIGFGHGLRNRYAEAKANGDLELARTYVSTTYAVLTIIFSIVWVIFIFGSLIVDWSTILNAPPEKANELFKLVIIVFSFFCLQTVLKIINTVTMADQKPAKAAFVDMLGQLLVLAFVYLLTETTNGSLVYLGLALGLAPTIILITSSLFFYSNEYKYFSPSINFVKFKYAHNIMGIGVKFFIIQIAVIVMFQTNNILIAHICNNEEVAIFNIAYKYMGVSLMIFSIIISPFWSAFTDAYSKKDYVWMKSAVKKLRLVSLAFILLPICMIYFSKFVYTLWINNLVIIPLPVSISVSVFIIMLSLVTLNTQILNGIGKVKMQLITYVFGTIFHVPVAIILGKKFGVVGIVSSASFFCSIIIIFSIIQVNLLIDNKAQGIWNK